MIIDFLNSAIKNILRNTKNKILIIIFTLLFILLFVDVIFLKNFNDYIDYAVNNNIGFRTFYIYSENKEEQESIDEIKKLDHVLDVYNTKYSIFVGETDLTFTGLDGELAIKYGTQNTIPKSIIGKSIADIKSGEIICPYVFYPDSNASLLNIDKDKIIEPDKALNLEFNLYYNKRNSETNRDDITKESKKFKVVGLYDSTQVMNYNNECYLNSEDIKFLIDSEFYQTNDELTYLSVIADKQENIEQIKNEISNMGYMVDEGTTVGFDTSNTTMILTLSSVLFLIIWIAIFFIIVNYANKNLKEEGKYLGIIRACGYNKKQIILKYITEKIVMISISYLISLPIFLVMFNISKNSLFKKYNYLGFYVNNNLLILITLFFMVLIFSIIIDYYIVNSYLKNSVTNNMKEE